MNFQFQLTTPIDTQAERESRAQLVRTKWTIRNLIRTTSRCTTDIKLIAIWTQISTIEDLEHHALDE